MVASAVSVHNTVKDLITEALNDLSDCFNETVVVSTLLGHQGVCVDMFSPGTAFLSWAIRVYRAPSYWCVG